MNKQIRQGDVFLERVESLPAGLIRHTGDTVLAYGEVTGHAHRVIYHAELFRAEDGAQYLQISGARDIKAGTTVKVLRVNGKDVAVDAGFAQPVRFDISELDISGGMATVKSDAQLLRHEEHDYIALQNGIYLHKAPQREYHPQELRNVAD